MKWAFWRKPPEPAARIDWFELAREEAALTHELMFRNLELARQSLPGSFSQPAPLEWPTIEPERLEKP